MGKSLLPLRSKAVKSTPCVPTTSRSGVRKELRATYPTDRSLGRTTERAWRSMLRDFRYPPRSRSAPAKTLRGRKMRSHHRARSAPRRLGTKAECIVAHELLRYGVDQYSDPTTPCDKVIEALAQQIPMMPSMNRYAIGDHVIGKGGFGTIYSGVDLITGEDVAIKKINRHWLDKKNQKGCLVSEIGVMGTFDSPFLMKAHGWYADEDYVYVVMALAKSDVFNAQLNAPNRRVSENDSAYILASALLGLRELHNRGVMHGDIKGENLLVRHDGSVALTDFGLSRYVAPMERNMRIRSNVHCRSIEEFEGKGVCIASDLWAMGVMAFELLTGDVPFGSVGTADEYFRLRDCRLVYPDSISLSPLAKDFVGKLICREENRMDVNAILKHPFLTLNAPKNIMDRV